MKRQFAMCFVSLLCCAFAAWNAPGTKVVPTRLIPEQEAQTIGLTRAWFAQAPVDGDREEITTATLCDGTIFTTTERGLLTAFDAETGATLWTTRVGESKLTAPGVNSKIVAILSGTTLVVYDRANGKKIAETAVGGQPSSAPIVSEREIYVPLFSQRIHAYSLKKSEEDRPELEKAVEAIKNASEGLRLSPAVEKKFNDEIEAKRSKQYRIEPLDDVVPFSCPSLGVSLVAPTMGTQSYSVDRIGWTTDEGWLLIGELRREAFEDALQLLYRLRVESTTSYMNSARVGTSVVFPRDDVSSSPFYLSEDVSRQNMNVVPERRKGGLFVVGTKSGRVYAINDANGQARWVFLANAAVDERIFAFGERAYVPTANGEFFAISLFDGKEVWKANGVRRFVSASETRLYGLDDLGRLVALNAETGERVKTLKIPTYKFELFNKETDRLYFVSADGLIQCFRETQQVEPIRRSESCADVSARLRDEMDAELDRESLGKPKSRPVAAPAEAASTPAAESDPFGDDSSSEFEEELEEDDPFGDDAPASSPAPTSAPADEEDDPFASNPVAPFGEEI